MSKGGSKVSWGSTAPAVGEQFDEHERDTARRDYPPELVGEASRRTLVDGGEIRTSSGTRPAITRDLVDRHLLERAAAPVPPDADVFSRPTVAGMPIVTLPPSVQPSPPAAEAPAPAPTPQGNPIATWVVGVVLLALIVLVSAAGTVGFFLGRRSMSP